MRKGFSKRCNMDENCYFFVIKNVLFKSKKNQYFDDIFISI